MTLCRAGIQHRVRMTGNQPGQDDLLPRPALLPNVPLDLHIRTYVLICQGLLTGSVIRDARGESLYCRESDREPQRRAAGLRIPGDADRVSDSETRAAGNERFFALLRMTGVWAAAAGMSYPAAHDVR